MSTAVTGDHNLAAIGELSAAEAEAWDGVQKARRFYNLKITVYTHVLYKSEFFRPFTI